MTYIYTGHSGIVKNRSVQMRTIHTLLLIIFFTCTISVYSQQSQETVDALQAQRLTRLEVDYIKNAESLAKLSTEFAALRSALDRFTGMGMGIGATLTMLQVLLVIITFRNGKK